MGFNMVTCNVCRCVGPSKLVEIWKLDCEISIYTGYFIHSYRRGEITLIVIHFSLEIGGRYMRIFKTVE